MENIFRRAVRLSLFHLTKHRQKTPWKWLKFYPHIVPKASLLKQWQASEWPVYQQWIDNHATATVQQWRALHRLALSWDDYPRLSIVTPVYNTAPEILKACILSVRTQTAPFWELILADDGSTEAGTLEVLDSTMCWDPRIHVLRADLSGDRGISAATNRAIAKASGEHIIFLDHDDRLAPEAVQSVCAALRTNPELDIIYSDRDMLSPDDKRFMHLMKPDWSPENLYSGNYIFHLMCYRKELVNKVGNLRSDYDGSQDYDLILRCMEHAPKVKHISQVLYHWRQHGRSVALHGEVKSYAFDAGTRALEDALRRRRVKARVHENKTLARGIYQLHLPPGKLQDISKVQLPKQADTQQYNRIVSNTLAGSAHKRFILIQSKAYKEKDHGAVEKMAAWLELDGVGMVSGCLVDQADKFVYAGMTLNRDGRLIRPYAGYPFTEPGYMAVTKITRNISCPDPFCVMMRREVWQALDGFDPELKGPHALLDLALRALQQGWRIVYLPAALFCCTTGWEITAYDGDRQRFLAQWRQWLTDGDPCYNKQFSPESIQYDLIEE